MPLKLVTSQVKKNPPLFVLTLITRILPYIYHEAWTKKILKLAPVYMNPPNLHDTVPCEYFLRAFWHSRFTREAERLKRTSSSLND